MTTHKFLRATAHDGRTTAAQLHDIARTEGAEMRPTTLLVLEPDHPQQLIARSNGPWVRLVARLFRHSLEAQLGRGRSPDSSRLLAIRAQELVSPTLRMTLADDWRNLLRHAQVPPVRRRDPRVPLNRTHILAHQVEIHAMLDALETPLPVPARGVAMAGRLLTDGTGPLYDRRRSADLRSVLRHTTAELDPWRALDRLAAD
jgi:hypothetical protein